MSLQRPPAQEVKILQHLADGYLPLEAYREAGYQRSGGLKALDRLAAQCGVGTHYALLAQAVAQGWVTVERPGRSEG